MDIPRSSEACDNAGGILLLDGATGTNLFAAGMPQGVCVEEWILNNPDTLMALQAEFINAGSKVIYAPTFSANRAKLIQFGLQDKAAQMNRELVSLTKTAVRSSGKNVLIAGDLSPTGLFVEPFGETSFDELVSIYAEQAEALAEAGVDLFVIETMLSVCEARAAVFACRKYNKPIYVTVTINEKGRMLSGASPMAAMITLQELSISGFGLNCSNGPAIIAEQLEKIASFATVPLIAKPNAGLPNPLLQNVYELSPTVMAELLKKCIDAGAGIIGGCCGTTPEHIKELDTMLSGYLPPCKCKQAKDQSNDIFLTSETGFFALDNDRLEFSEPIKCEFDMADILLEAADDSLDVILIEAESIEEGEQFALNAHFSKLPVCFKSSSLEALRRCLYLYHGRAMLDSESPVDEEGLKALAKEFGAVVY